MVLPLFHVELDSVRARLNDIRTSKREGAAERITASASSRDSPEGTQHHAKNAGFGVDRHEGRSETQERLFLFTFPACHVFSPLKLVTSVLMRDRALGCDCRRPDHGSIGKNPAATTPRRDKEMVNSMKS